MKTQDLVALDPNALTTSIVGRRLEVSVPTVTRWANAGRLPCRRLANGIRVFAAADVEKLARELKK